MTPEDRISEIQKTLEAIQNGWPFFLALLDQRIADLTEQLINNDSERVRGQILAMRWVKELPESLYQEQRALSEAITDEAASD